MHNLSIFLDNVLGKEVVMHTFTFILFFQKYNSGLVVHHKKEVYFYIPL